MNKEQDKNTITETAYFDANEEIGGTILEFIRDAVKQSKTSLENAKNNSSIKITITATKSCDNELKEDNTAIPFKIPNGKVFKKVQMPTKDRPYCIFDDEKVSLFVNAKENAIPALKELLTQATSEEDICEGLYIADRMLEAGTQGMDKLYYPTFSRFNNSNSPSVQSFLAGIYRRILVPDAFGPLIKMLFKNILTSNDTSIDPTEKIGSAILEQIKAPKILPL